MVSAAPDLPRRLRAARALAGYSRVEDLADVLNEPGLGARTLRAIEQGRRIPAPRELPAIAEACDVSIEFLTAPDDVVRRPRSVADVGAGNGNGNGNGAANGHGEGVREESAGDVAAILSRIESKIDDWQDGGEGRALLLGVAARLEEQSRFAERTVTGVVGELHGRFDRLEDLLHGGQDRRDALQDLGDVAGGEQGDDRRDEGNGESSRAGGGPPA